VTTDFEEQSLYKVRIELPMWLKPVDTGFPTHHQRGELSAPDGKLDVIPDRNP
jgi:hypothetical protein